MSSRSSPLDRKSTRLNSSHANILYAVFCLQKKTGERVPQTQDCLTAVECDSERDKRKESDLTLFWFIFFNDPATAEIYTLSIHDALPICAFFACSLPS